MKNINISQQVDEYIFYLDDIRGKELYNSIRENSLSEINSDHEERGAFLALQFLIIPYLSTAEICSLIRDDLFLGTQIDDIDITERLNKKLLFMHLADRDNFKKEIKSALLSNKEQITAEMKNDNSKSLKTINDWLLDYVAQSDKNKSDTLLKAEYFYQKPYFTKLPEDEKKVLRKLFALYNFLNTSSMTPEGFEDDLLMMNEQGQLITTNKGKVVVLYDTKRKGVTSTRSKARTISGPPKTVEEKEIDRLKVEEEKYMTGGLEQQAIKEEMEKKKKVEDLKAVASKYKPDSLEYKAMMEEIEKIKK